MKVQRLIANSNASLGYFYSHTFKFDNFNFIDLNNSIPKHEIDEFCIAEKVFSNTELYGKTLACCLKYVLGETKQHAAIAKARFPKIYFITRTIHAIVLFTVFKLFYKCLLHFV